MANNRIWVIGGTLIAIVVLALGGLLGVKPQLDAAQARTSERADVDAANQLHRTEIVALEEQSTRIGEYQDLVTDLRNAIPALPELDAFSGELAGLQASTGAQVTGLSPQSTALFAPSGATSALVPGSVAGSSFAAVTITVTATGTRDQTVAFVKGLQSASRLMLVTDVSIIEADDGVNSLTVSGLVYFFLDTPYVDPNAAPVETPAPDALASE